MLGCSGSFCSLFPNRADVYEIVLRCFFISMIMAMLYIVITCSEFAFVIFLDLIVMLTLIVA